MTYTYSFASHLFYYLFVVAMTEYTDWIIICRLTMLTHKGIKSLL
jgi:hypothetical protein